MLETVTIIEKDQMIEGKILLQIYIADSKATVPKQMVAHVFFLGRLFLSSQFQQAAGAVLIENHKYAFIFWKISNNLNLNIISLL